MRIIKLSKEMENFHTKAEVKDFFERGLHQENEGIFYCTNLPGKSGGHKLGSGGVKSGEILVFTWDSQVVYIGAAADDILTGEELAATLTEHDDPEDFYAGIPMEWTVSVEGLSLARLEKKANNVFPKITWQSSGKRKHMAKRIEIGRVNFVMAQGWPIVRIQPLADILYRYILTFV